MNIYYNKFLLIVFLLDQRLKLRAHINHVEILLQNLDQFHLDKNWRKMKNAKHIIKLKGSTKMHISHN